MEQMIIFLKTAYAKQITFEYNDQYFYMTEKNEEKAFNLIQMQILDANDLDVRFADADHYGFLEKVAMNWRSRLSSFFSGTIQWNKYLYTLKNGIVYVFEVNNYDKPVSFFSLEVITLQEAADREYNKKYVFKLMKSDEEPIALAAEDEEKYKKWVNAIRDQIDYARSKFNK